MSSTFVSCRVSPPLVSTMNTLSWSPSRFERNAIFVPSGERAVERRVGDLLDVRAPHGHEVDVVVLVPFEVRLDRDPPAVWRELRIQHGLLGLQEDSILLR